MKNKDDNFFKERKGHKKIRHENNRHMAPYKYLIVCEGKKTEPYYFEQIKELINKKYNDSITVEDRKINIEIKGTGKNTCDLVTFTQNYVNHSNNYYGSVWIIFDKDDFTDEQFNDALKQAKDNGYNAGWSNESIELWFLLHFEYLQSAVGRQSYISRLNYYFKKFKLKEYKKNMRNIFDILTQYGSLDNAIKNAEKLMKKWN